MGSPSRLDGPISAIKVADATIILARGLADEKRSPAQVLCCLNA